ncbi:MAG: biotin--[acetyl-CoA-carboxylase] ligase [Burkholderiales bacterium]
MKSWPADAIDRIGKAVAQAWPGMTFELLSEIDSTNSELMRRARAGRTAPTLLVAETQSGGRGRLGRGWAGSAGDSLTFSIAATLAPVDWSGLSLAVGVALADALDPDRALGIRIKWPNDLWVSERKLAGILVETVAAASTGETNPRRRHAVIGIGINIGPQRAEGLSTPPAWLAEIEPDASAPAVLLRIAAPLVAALKAFESMGFAPFHGRFDARDLLRDGPVTAAGPGAEPLVGTAQGVSADGALLVLTADGMKAVTSSEVSVRPAQVPRSVGSEAGERRMFNGQQTLT